MRLTQRISTSRRRARVATVAAIGAAVLIVPIALAVNASAAIPATPAGWTLVFSDDFNGAANTGVNTGNWLYDLGHGYPGGAGNWGTGEVENVTNSTANVFQDGASHLVIKPIRDGAGNWTSNASWGAIRRSSRQSPLERRTTLGTAPLRMSHARPPTALR